MKKLGVLFPVIAIISVAVAVIYIFTLNIVVTVAAGRIRTFSAVSVILSERLSGL